MTASRRINTVLFGVIAGILLSSLHLLQFLTLFFLIISRKVFKFLNSLGQVFFGSIVVLLVSLFFPIELCISGDVVDENGELRVDSAAIVTANHQIYTDWMYLWAFAWAAKMQGYLKIMLRYDLQYVPILGPGMMFFEFIFLKRKWSIDQHTLMKAFTQVNADKLPVWLLLFPEGTVICKDTHQKMVQWAKQSKYSETLPKHVLVPKATGTFTACQLLRPHVKTLYDITVAYNGYDPKHHPYDVFPLTGILFERKAPTKVHLHVTKYSIDDLPGVKSHDQQEFTDWIRGLYMEKDAHLQEFHRTGSLVPGGVVNGVHEKMLIDGNRKRFDSKMNGTKSEASRVVRVPVKPGLVDMLNLVVVIVGALGVLVALSAAIGIYR